MESEELTEEQIKCIREAMKIAEADAEDWRKKTRVRLEDMRTPINRLTHTTV